MKLLPSLHAIACASALACGFAAGCGGDAATTGTTTAARTTRAPAPPAPAPDGLAAEFVVRSPQDLWDRLRAELGAAGDAWPKSLAGLVGARFELPLAIVSAIDGESAVVAAVGENGGVLGAAVAFRVSDGGRVVRELSGGRHASHTAEAHDGMTVLRPRRQALSDWAPALGVIDDHVVIALGERDVVAYGPYLARTLAPRDPPAADVTARLLQAGLRGPGKRLLGRALARLDEVTAGSAASALGDATDIRESLEDVLGRLSQVAIDATLASGRLTLRAALDGDGLGDGPDANRADLLAMPGDSLASLTWAEDGETRVASAERGAERIAAALGEGLPAKARDALRVALRSLGQARGDRASAAARCSGMGLTAIARGELTDGGAASVRKGLEQLLALDAEPAVKRWLAARSLELRHKKTRVSNVPDEATRIKLVPKTAAPSGSVTADPSTAAAPIGPPVDVLVATGTQHFAITAGADADESLALLYDAEHSLAQRSSVADALNTLPARPRFLLWVDLGAVRACVGGRPGEAAEQAAWLGFGRDASTRGGWLVADLPAAVLTTFATAAAR